MIEHSQSRLPLLNSAKQGKQFKMYTKLLSEALATISGATSSVELYPQIFALLEQLLGNSQNYLYRLDNDQLQCIAGPSGKQSEPIPLTSKDIQHLFFRDKNNSVVSDHWPQGLTTFADAWCLGLTFNTQRHQYLLYLIFTSYQSNSNTLHCQLQQLRETFSNLVHIIENKKIILDNEKFQKQQQHIQQSMMQQDKLAAIGQLAAGVAHELNNPLAFIYSNLHSLVGYLDKYETFIKIACSRDPSLLDDYNSMDLGFLIGDTRDLLDESLSGARRARDIIQNLRTFSHPDEKTRTSLNIFSLLRDTVRIANTQVKHHAQLQLRLCAEEVFVSGNATQLGQVLLNLIGNASQAVSQGKGVITISTALDCGSVIIRFQDNGSGISEDVLPHIFEPFYTTKDVGQGTGLGLPLSKAIVEQHGGKLTLDHTSKDGSCFTVVLPIDEPR